MRIISGKARGTKLYTLEGLNTRPTLDRIKESLFNIIQNKLVDSTVLDLFSGSGALALESLSRGAKRAILCDNNIKAIEIIKKNIEKCHFEDCTNLNYKDYKKCIQDLNEQVDIIFIDPPYRLDIAIDAIKKILESEILKEDSLIVLETDEEERELKELEKVEKIEIKDLRRYGRVKLIFLNKKGM